MGVPMMKILEISAGVAGVAIGGGKAEKIELEENELLAQILRQATITNAVLLKILEHDDPDSFAELMEELA